MVLTNKKLSLLNYFMRFRQLPGSHDILHAKSLQETKKPTNKNHNARYLEIEYKIPGTNTKTTKSIQYIESLEEIDILSWIEQFKNYSNIFKWNEAIRMAYLTELVENEEEIMDGNKDSLEILDSLLQKNMTPKI